MTPAIARWAAIPTLYLLGLIVVLWLSCIPAFVLPGGGSGWTLLGVLGLPWIAISPFISFARAVRQ